MKTRANETLRAVFASALPGGIEIGWTNPQWLQAGLRRGLDTDTVVAFNPGRQEWSKSSENNVTTGGNPVRVPDRDRDDTWPPGIGLIRAFDDRRTSQGVRVVGDYSSNMFVLVGATRRSDF